MPEVASYQDYNNQLLLADNLGKSHLGFSKQHFQFSPPKKYTKQKEKSQNPVFLSLKGMEKVIRQPYIW